MNTNDIQLTLRARAAFDGSLESIDADTRRRLRELRLGALRGEKAGTSVRRAWTAGIALGTAFMLAIFLPRLWHAPVVAIPVAGSVAPAADAATQAERPVGGAEDIATAIPSDAFETVDPDMLSDLDFYGWLATQPSTSSSGG